MVAHPAVRPFSQLRRARILTARDPCLLPSDRCGRGGCVSRWHDRPRHPAWTIATRYPRLLHRGPCDPLVGRPHLGGRDRDQCDHVHQHSRVWPIWATSRFSRSPLATSSDALSSPIRYSRGISRASSSPRTRCSSDDSDAETRRFASVVFMVTRALADSVRIFATAIPIGLILALRGGTRIRPTGWPSACLAC